MSELYNEIEKKCSWYISEVSKHTWNSEETNLPTDPIVCESLYELYPNWVGRLIERPVDPE